MRRLLYSCAGLLRGGLAALLAPATDPRVAFASAQQRQHELLGLARRALGELAATSSQLESRMLAIQAHLPRLEQEAQQALGAGREDLARVALRRRYIGAAELRAIEQHVQDLRRKEQLLALHEERLAAQVEAFQARLKFISASYGAAEVQVRMNEAFGSVSEGIGDLSLVLEQAEHQADQMQERAYALESLLQSAALEGSGQTPGEDELIEAEIAALKRRLNAAGAAPE